MAKERMLSAIDAHIIAMIDVIIGIIAGVITLVFMLHRCTQG